MSRNTQDRKKRPGIPAILAILSAAALIVTLTCLSRQPEEILPVAELNSALQEPLSRNSIPMSEFMGINTSLGSYDSNLIEEIGRVFKWIREYHKWNHLEPANDLYLWDSQTPSPYGGTWPNHQEFISACQRHQIQVLVCVEQATTWASSDGTVTGMPVNSGKGSQESDYAERAEYMAQLAARYGQNTHPEGVLESTDKLSGLNLIRYFEDFNEQNQDWQNPRWPAAKYARFLNAVHDGTGLNSTPSLPLLGIKAGDPQSFHVMGGLTDADTDYLDEILAETDGRLPFDALNIHLYCTDLKKAYAPEHPRFGLKTGVDTIKAWRDAKAPGKEIWLTEFGWDTYIDGPRRSWVSVSEQSQANYLMRSFALLNGWGIDKAFMFIFKDPSSTDPIQFSSSGIIRDAAHGHSRKLAYYYLATMQKLLGNLRFDRILSTGEGVPEVYGYRFTNPGGTESVSMLWCRDPGSDNDNGTKLSNYMQTVPFASACQMIHPVAGSLTGTASPLSVSGTETSEAQVQIPELSETPVFIKCQVSRPKWSQYVAFSQQKPDSFHGVAVSNFSEETAHIDFLGFTSDGIQIPAALESPKTDLAPHTQLARLASELFPSGADPKSPRWILIESDSPGIAGFFLHGNNALTRLDGALTSIKTAKRLIFTRTPSGAAAFRGKDAETDFWLVNPSDSPVRIEISLKEGNDLPSPGSIHTAQKTEEIPAWGVLQGSIEAYFGTSGSPTYAEIDVLSGGGINGFERIQLANGETVAGLSAVEPGSGNRFYSAQLAHSATIFTHLRLINAGSEDRKVSIRAVDQDGEEILGLREHEIPANLLLEGDVSNLIWTQEAKPAEFTGSLIVEADGPGIIGDVIFGDPDNHRFAAALPLAEGLFQQSVFSHVANLPPFFTGLALFNAQASDAQILIQVWDRNGQLTGETIVTLGAGRRRAGLLTEFIPETAGQNSGQVIVTSDVPIAAQQLFGDLSLKLLAAVPPIEGGTLPNSHLDSDLLQR